MYTTVTRVLYEDKGSETGAAPATAVDQRKLLTAINKVTTRLQHIAWDFEPHYGTEYFTAQPEIVNVGWGALNLVNAKGQRFLLASLVDVPIVTVSGQALAFGLNAASAPQVLPVTQNTTPIKNIRFNDGNGAICQQSWYPTCLPLLDSISIQGWWGFRHDYASAYVDSLDSVQDNPLSVSATTMTVLNVNGQDAQFWSPRFDAGNLIRIENELILILATNSSTNTLSVRRGVNGTTAAGHNQGTDITIWYPEEDVQDTVARQAAYFYARRGSYEAVSISAIATAVYPPDMVDELYAMLEGYQHE